jgi:hypothetical protein
MQNFNGFNPYGNYPQYQTQRYGGLRIIPVSNIMEANATPVNDLEPVFFFNRAENVIYKKQIDNTGAAPIQTYKLEILEAPKENPIESKLNLIDERLNSIETLLKPVEKEAKK